MPVFSPNPWRRPMVTARTGMRPLQADPKLFCGAIDLRFPIESDELWAVMQHSPLNYPHNNDRSISVQVNVVNLGNAQILTIPGEALPNIGFYLKRKMHGQHNLLFGLTNDALGYILTKVDFNSFETYEYISRVSLGEMTGEILMAEALKFLSNADLVKHWGLLKIEPFLRGWYRKFHACIFKLNSCVGERKTHWLGSGARVKIRQFDVLWYLNCRHGFFG